MSRLTRSSRVDLDYAVLHKTGERVLKDRQKMAEKGINVQAINIRSDVEDFFDSYDFENLDELEDVQEYIMNLGNLKREFRRVHAQVKETEGAEFGTKYSDFDKLLNDLNYCFTTANQKLSGIKDSRKQIEKERFQEAILAEENRLSQAKLEQQTKIANVMFCAENQYFEIQFRHETLTEKCSVNVDKLDDYEIMDLKKREENFHVELRELIEKVSLFDQFVLPCGELAKQKLTSATKMRDHSTKVLKKFLDDVDRVIKERVISEKKLENAANLKIELSKFKGYNSEVDIYTFRSEFSKLIEPYVIKSLWAAYLKKNLLGGAAYDLVAKIDSIEKNWEKLLEVYGDTHLMLQNRISSLEKLSLEKLRDDEKIAEVITKLLNCMADLRQLAEDNDLECELYYGGGTHKILDLLGKQRQRKFIKEIAKKKKINDKEKWGKLVTFLETERSEREAYILHEKVRKSMNAEKSDDKERERSKRDKEKVGDSNLQSYQSQMDQPLGNSVEKYLCHICGKDQDHVLSFDPNNKPYVEYVACKVFVSKSPRDRDKLLFQKKLCGKCLKSGAKWNSDHSCSKGYLCNQTYVKNGKKLRCEKHVLTCGYHCKGKQNKDLLELYKRNVIRAHGKFFEFSKDISISCFSEIYNSDSQNSDLRESSVFLFQTIDVAGLKLNLFYDSGCGDLIVTKDAVDKLMQIGRAKQTSKGPIVLSGVGKQESISEYGNYSVRLPLQTGSEAIMNGICVDEITIPFPKYHLKVVEEDIRENIGIKDKELLARLPRLPCEVGGIVDVMIGKQYLKYFPLEIVRLDSGLTIYESLFESSDGSTGIVAGPHPEFTKIERTAHFVHEEFHYYSPCVQQYNELISMQNEVPFLGYKGLFAKSDLLQSFSKSECPGYEMISTNFDQISSFYEKVDNRCEFGDPLVGGSGLDVIPNTEVYNSKRGPKNLKSFEELENIGTNISYRCVDCRNCNECKKGSLVEEISIQEEFEQNLINKSVKVDTEKYECSAYLPFLADPDVRLETNLKIARKVYNSQLRTLSKINKDRCDVIDAEDKLQKLGFVDYLHNLNKEDQQTILSSPVQYYIPWRVVWGKSVSTPVRPVFDASMRTAGGCSLNDVLPKGSNNMNNLVQILIRWLVKRYAYHTDISKMYNRIKMEKCHWRFQLYLWDENLDPGREPKTKVIKTCIYGVRPSGNQAERALRLTSTMFMNEYPKAYSIVQNDIYVDDCISGEDTEVDREIVTEELSNSLRMGGFSLKGFTFSGNLPDKNLSADKQSVGVGGLKWYPKEDSLMFNLGELNLAKKIRGRKVEKKSVTDNITMRDCVSIVAEVFDPLGRIAPIIAGFKLDISTLHRSGLNWGDLIPENLKGIWSLNFEMIKDIRNVRYQRAIVPEDAKNLDIVTIDTGDASSSLICSAIYARFERNNGSFSCQLVFSRTKVLPEGISTPRAELMAAVLNAATGHTVKKAFGTYHKRVIKLTDSMVALHWISSNRNTLKTWVRTRVIEVNRLCDTSDWRYVKTTDMVADLGTRKGARVCDVDQKSEWINGLPWMSGPENNFPTLALEEIKLNQQDIAEAKKESIIVQTFFSKSAEFDGKTDEKIKKRYQFSNYLIDPNRFRFRKIIRVLALVLIFIKRVSKNIKHIQESKNFKHNPPSDFPEVLKFSNDRYAVTTARVNDMNLRPSAFVGGKVVELTERMLKSAMYYFSIKASEELKRFSNPCIYSNIAKDIDGVLYYSGRILENYKFGGYPELCETAIDLCRTTFCVPIMDQYSPVAIAIALEIHWYHPDAKHKGVDVIWRQMQRVAHIIGGQKLSIAIKQGCKKCRILNNKSIEVAMGPIQDVNLCIAPAFFASQIDIFGPMKTYSIANKRATMKIWFLIFCCCTTGAIDIRVLEDYSTDAVVLAFIRFSCRFGFPKYALPDAGSQLVKACTDMRYSFSDTKNRLFTNYGIHYTLCPVGAHYQHGKVERKIREVRKSVKINVQHERLSIVQWETLMQQIANSINNLPIGLRKRSQCLENLDIITPNRLILGRNNERCPNAPLVICADHKMIIETNANIFRAWFQAWITNCVPLLIDRPKWHKTNQEICIGDIVLFLKSEKEFDKQYQYGRVCSLQRSNDGNIRKVEVTYRNSNEGVNRVTQRGVRELVVVFPVDELDIYEKLDKLID